jgi:hypothetical protein
MTTITYSTKAAADDVREFYRGLFDGQGLKFSPIVIGSSATIRAVDDCGNLTVVITGRPEGSAVRVSCAVKLSQAPLPSGGSYEENAARMKERHDQAVAEMGIHRQRQDAPAPPLVWPDWLTHVKGAELSLLEGKDQSGHSYLRSRYVTSTPMTQIYAFYKDLLPANGYSVYRSALETGQTISGVQQNANGYVEGSRYPDGSPGPRIEIRVGFSRANLNDPITVDIRVTPFAYKAPPAREP